MLVTTKYVEPAFTAGMMFSTSLVVMYVYRAHQIKLLPAFTIRYTYICLYKKTYTLVECQRESVSKMTLEL